MSVVSEETVAKEILVKMPYNNEGIEPEIQVSRSLVIVGANGSGKSKLGFHLEKNLTSKYLNNRHVQRISAQRSINIPQSSPLLPHQEASDLLLYGYTHINYTYEQLLKNKIVNKWGNEPTTRTLSDYDRVLATLFAKEKEISIQYRIDSKNNVDKLDVPETPIDRLKTIWGKLLPEVKIEFKDGRVEACNDNNQTYHGKEMSDGERVILYFMGQCLCMPKNSIIVIDEPEIHIHKAILNKLWDALEEERDDCIFIYITHDLDFVSTRRDAKKIWVKSYNGTKWDWLDITDTVCLPEELLLKVLGSKKNILFFEGDNKNSKDKKIYELLFPDFTIFPCGSCQKVIDFTKSYQNDILPLHNLKAFGFVDKDNRTYEEIEKLKQNNIHAINFREIENVLCSKEIIEYIARIKEFDPKQKFEEVKNKVMKLFEDNIEDIAFEIAKRELENKLENIFNVVKSKEELSELKKELTSFDENEIISEYIIIGKKAIESKDYEKVLEFYKNKGLLGQVQHILDERKLSEYIIRLLQKKDNDLLKILRKKLPQIG